MEAIKGLYHPDKIDAESFIENFTIRLKEFAAILKTLEKQGKKPLQHFLITGKRGMGKSTLLRRIFLEAEKKPVSDKLFAVRLGSEQYRLSRLYKLWEEVIKHLSIEEPLLNDKRLQLSEEKHYEESIIQIVVSYLNEQDKTLLLLIDNFDQLVDKLSTKEQHALREILIQYPVQIIGTTIFYDEHFISYNKPFFDFFKVVSLKNLNKEESVEFIKQLAAKEEIENFEQIFTEQKSKIQTLRILSGGVPRTLVVLLSILSKQNTGGAIDYLNEMLEQVTPLYQDRMKALSPQQQEIMHHLAIRWDRTPVKELATDMRLPSKSISAQLAQLEGNGYINKINTTNRNLFYEIDERFFNIWLLMSEASAYDAKRVLWLTRWLDMFYDSKQLEDYALYCNTNLKQAKPANRFLITRALSESEKLSYKIKDRLVSETSKDLSVSLPEIKQWETTYGKKKADNIKALTITINDLIEKKDFNKALSQLNVLKDTDEKNALSGIGYVYELKQDYDNAEKYYMMAVEKGHLAATANLGRLYDDVKKDYDNAEKYYLMATEKGNVAAMYNLGNLYREVKQDYNNAEKHYLMAVEKGLADAMYNLGLFYEEVKKDYENAEKYYLMAVEKDHTNAMYNLGLFYDEVKKDYTNAEKYYLMAVEKGDVDAMYNLADLYREVKKDYDNAEKNYLMAAEKGHTNAMYNLGLFYHEVKKNYENAEKYYLMAVEKGEVAAMNNLAFLYFLKNDDSKKEKALEIISGINNIEAKAIFISTYILMLLWNGKIKEAHKFLNILLDGHIKDETAVPIISANLTRLLVFKQKQILHTLFKKQNRLIDIFKPVYFALMHEMKAEFPNEYLRMPEELEEPVSDLLKFVQQERDRLGIA